MILPTALALLTFSPVAAPTGSAPSADAPRAQLCRVALLPFETRGLKPDEGHIGLALSEAMASTVEHATGCSALTAGDIDAMVDFEEARLACGAGDSCMIELGNALGVERVVGGSISRLGSSYAVQAKVIDIGGTAVIARADRTVHADPTLLPGVAKELAAELFGLPTEAEKKAAAEAQAQAIDDASFPWLTTLGGVMFGGAALGVVALGAGAAAAFAITQVGSLDPQLKVAAVPAYYALGAGAALSAVVVPLGGVVFLTGYFIE